MTTLNLWRSYIKTKNGNCSFNQQLNRLKAYPVQSHMLKDEMQIKIITYALALENRKFYVGKTWNLNLRYAQHLYGQGAGWTKIHKPISIMEVWHGDHEKELCLEYMKNYGYENVRGAGWCQTIIKRPKELSCDNGNERPDFCDPRNDLPTNLPDILHDDKDRSPEKD